MSHAASPMPEQSTVRWGARAGALAVALIAALIFMHRFSVAAPGLRGDGVTVVSISVESLQSVRKPRQPERRPPPQAPVIFTQAAAPAQPMSTTAPGEAYKLWSYSSGRIVFNNADQYERCRQARAHGSEAADCPPATDRHEMMLVVAANTSAPPGLILRHTGPRGWR